MKADSLPVEEFLLQSHEGLIIDVRAPIEYKKGHLPRSVNIALFDDLERAEIGTLYKSNGKEEAILKGLELVSPKLTQFILETKSLIKNEKVFVYCFRGGMRSNSFAWLLNTAGLEAKIMEGGYKAFRNYTLKQFERPFKLILLGGPTGSGKTEVLKHLKTKISTIDLENLAHHKGSAFGNINQPKQLPQQLFENKFCSALNNFTSENSILLEDESMSIGYNKIPYPFWKQMKKAPIIKLKVPFDLRVKRLVSEYGTGDIPALSKSIENIAQQLGYQNYKNCMKLLGEGRMAEVAEITLKYYDKAYEYNHTKKNITKIVSIDSDTDDSVINAQKVLEVYEDISRN